MKKIVINACYGGFGLSMAAIARLAELRGKPCYFFTDSYNQPFSQILPDAKNNRGWFHAFDVPNPNDFYNTINWASRTEDERSAMSDWFRAHTLTEDPERNDPFLVQVVEELGNGASGHCAELKIVEVPDDVQCTIDEYDGMEHVSESHRKWH